MGGTQKWCHYGTVTGVLRLRIAGDVAAAERREISAYQADAVPAALLADAAAPVYTARQLPLELP